MNQPDRTALLQRLADADRWLTRVYDTQRSPEHRDAMWEFLMQHTNPKLKQILIVTRLQDEEAINYYNTYGRN